MMHNIAGKSLQRNSAHRAALRVVEAFACRVAERGLPFDVGGVVDVSALVAAEQLGAVQYSQLGAIVGADILANVDLFATLAVPRNLRATTLRCVDMLKAWMRGHVDWGKKTARYLEFELPVAPPEYLDDLLTQQQTSPAKGRRP